MSRAWDAALSEFSDELARSSRSAATCEGYLKHVGWLAESMGTVGPWEVNTAQLAAWLDAQSWSRTTRRKVLVSLRTFYAWGIAGRRLEWAPTAGLPSPTPNKRGPARWVFPPAWRVHVEGYLSALRARDCSEGTLQVRRWWLRRLSEVCADPWAVSTQQLALWLSNPDWSAETKRAARSCVRSFYRWAVRGGLVSVSPAEDLEPVLLPRTLPRPAPLDAVREALAAADDRTRLAVLLAVLGGLRRAEIARLHTTQVTDVDMLIVGKGGHHRRVPLHPLLAEEFAAERSRRRRGEHGTGWSGRFVTEHGYWFPSDRDPGPITPAHLGKIVSAVLPGEWAAHSLRHRFASESYALERDLLAVQTLLGHSRPETTARYAAVPDGALTRAVSAINL